MRFVFVAIALVACSTRQNPNVCCENEAQCAEVGFDDLQPCGAGQVCGSDHTCIAAECSTNSECSDDAPVCRSGFCESTCAGDEDCADVAGRTHCSNAACVQCSANEHCSAAAPFCDAEDFTCRGCERDSECASGVCIEIDGVCALESRVIYAAGPGGVTTGDCAASSPCKLDYALTKTRPEKDVIHFTTGTATLPPTTSTVTSQVILDGAPTMLTGQSGTPTFSIDTSTGKLTLQALILEAGFRVSVVGGTLRTHAIQGAGIALSANGGTLTVRRSDLRVGSRVDCVGAATVTVEQSMFADSNVVFNGCSSVIRRNRFTTTAAKPLDLRNGINVVENNLFTTTSEFTDMVHLTGGNGSSFRFNTIVSLSPTTDSGVALYCDSSVVISSNVFAYNSTNPIYGDGVCTVTSSLFDTQGASDAGANLVDDRSAFFVSLAQGDFHPATSSPARDVGEGGIVDVDLDGRARDAMPDIGALEHE